MKVLLTGSNGFIGSNLLHKFKDLGWHVWEINVDESTNKAPEYKNLETIIKQCDGIFHVGAISDTTLHDCSCHQPSPYSQTFHQNPCLALTYFQTQFV